MILHFPASPTTLSRSREKDIKVIDGEVDTIIFNTEKVYVSEELRELKKVVSAVIIICLDIIPLNPYIAEKQQLDKTFEFLSKIVVTRIILVKRIIPVK